MGNLNVTRLGPEAQADNELSYDERLGRNVVEVDPWYRPRSLRGSDIVAIGLVSGGIWLVCLLVFGGISAYACRHGCWSAEAVASRWLLYAWIALPLIVVVGGGLAAVWGYAQRTRAESARVAVTRDRLGNPVSAEAVLRQSEERTWAALRLATNATIAQAPYQTYRGVDALTLTNTAPVAAIGKGDQGLDVGPWAPERWLPHILRQPHTLLAAQTGGGKSTMARYLVAARLRERAQLYIIDPHWAPGNWWGLPGIGAAENWQEIAAAFEALAIEYRERLQRHAAGHTEFRKLCVVLDDAILVKAEFERHGKANPWTRFVTVLGSGARKVNMSVILMTQSANVQDLGISGPLRENYARLALDARTVKMLIQEDLDSNRRDALRDALTQAGPYPAAMEINNGEIVLLDRSGIVSVERPYGAEQALWLPSCPEPPKQAAGGAQEAPGDAGTGTGTDRPIDVLSVLRALRRAGKSRDEARDMLRDYGIEFRNDLWTQAGGN